MIVEISSSISLAIVVFIQVWDRNRSEKRQQERFNRVSDLVKDSQNMLEKSIELRDSERETWVVERQQLLDRIQAPSFGELKHAEVKTIKAQQVVKDPVPLEPL